MLHEIILTIILLYLVQICLCAIIHVINGSQRFPKTIKEGFKTQANLFWVLFNLKKLRS